MTAQSKIPKMTDVSVTEQLTSNSEQRFHYMDNLRASAMLIGIVFHVALAYSPLMHNVWFVADPQKSVILDFSVYLLHLFRMPLFFLIAGFFAFMLLEKRGITAFIKHRCKRILLPFVVFYPILLAAIIAAITWGVSFVENIPPILTILSENNMEDSAASTAHLWFLYNLFGFCLLAAALFKMKLLQHRLVKKMASLTFLLVIFPLLIVPALYSQLAPFPAPERFYPELWSYGFYGIFFLIGCAFYQNQTVFKQLERCQAWLFLLGLSSYIAFYFRIPSTISPEEISSMMKGEIIAPSGIEHFFTVLLQAIGAVYLSLLSLVVGKRFFNYSNTLMRYIADSSYWLYLVHIPLLLVIQFPLIDLNINLWLKFIISLVAILFIGFVSYWSLVRNSFIGVLLNGKKQ